MKERFHDWILKTVSPVPRRLLETSDGIETLPGSDRSLIWVPRRQTLKHTTFSLPEQLKGRKRNAALDIKVRAWAPFTDTGYAVLWRGSRASVFAWDKDITHRTIRSNGINPRQCQVVPEIFLREPLDTGVRLVELTEGVEAQVWKDGFVSTTRWWRSEPSPGDWILFKRSAAAELGDIPSQPIPHSAPEWLAGPWNINFASNGLLGQAILNKAVLIPLVTLLVLPNMFFLGQWTGYSVLNASVISEIYRIEAEGRSVRQERNRALSALEQVETLASLRHFPHQIEVVSRTHSLLSPYSIQISGWDYDEGILEFGLKSESDMDATVYIPLFENDPMFSRVSASTRGDRLMLRMNVTKHSEIQS